MSDSIPQALPRTHASPAMTSAGLSSSSRSPVYQDLLGGPPIPPPRTSSNQRSHRGGSNTTSTGSSGERGVSRHRSKGERREKKSDESRSRRQATQPSDPSKGSSARNEGSTQPEDLMETIPMSDPAVDIEREQARQATAPVQSNENASTLGLGVMGDESMEGGRGAMPSRQEFPEHTIKRKETTFGQYILGQTVGEGEFGKVKLGWKRDGSIEVAIKLIRRESLGTNPTRLPKIYREISILRDLSHPNIVRLHEMVETDRHIGIIMEYASGGELFDHILRNKYLKDNSARRLFAQLVSGVGYLHKKGIVHRDLKLENLLLDRNRNIIITDFGFANTFDPTDELSEEIEYNLTNKEFVKRMRLDKTNAKGLRRGDLMQTSCGSPCYAAPELVVSDSLYTGRRVDVWSCGVILYAMLAGYLPFDDDPANPDGDNINLLYKYIVTTPLTFPEYVTPHARDLLRRILVPDPRKRADLFEVARHSWLSEYADIVSHITSSTTKVADIASTTVTRGMCLRQNGSSRTSTNLNLHRTTQGRASTCAQCLCPGTSENASRPQPICWRPGTSPWRHLTGPERQIQNPSRHQAPHSASRIRCTPVTDVKRRVVLQRNCSECLPYGSFADEDEALDSRVSHAARTSSFLCSSSSSTLTIASFNLRHRSSHRDSSPAHGNAGYATNNGSLNGFVQYGPSAISWFLRPTSGAYGSSDQCPRPTRATEEQAICHFCADSARWQPARRCRSSSRTGTSLQVQYDPPARAPERPQEIKHCFQYRREAVRKVWFNIWWPRFSGNCTKAEVWQALPSYKHEGTVWW
ncbi:kinase-like domain-containing protein [Aspergillus venezuelensis]